VAKLEYRLTNDILSKMVFLKYPDLLKKLIAALLGIQFESIEEFVIGNPEIPPEEIGKKFCVLDIKMTVNSQKTVLELQVANEGDYPERSLYYWAREYTAALGEGERYRDLPRTIVVSIVAFTLFDCAEFHSAYQPLEITRHTLLTDKMSMIYFELPKLPETVSADDELRLWLTLFRAETEEDIAKLYEMGVPIMKQAIDAYRQVSATDEFKELERLRSRTRHNEASALGHARDEAYREAEEKWQGIVADKDASHAAAIADKDASLADKDAAHSAAIADKDALIAELRAQLGKVK
jgi:predicted transposase/invertase (TIGR01784 family)